jgi:hypothetical protein
MEPSELGQPQLDQLLPCRQALKPELLAAGERL